MATALLGRPAYPTSRRPSRLVGLRRSFARRFHRRPDLIPLRRAEISSDGVGWGTPVAELVPAFGRNGKAGVTVEHLLTHTAGIDEHVAGALPYATREEHH
jgi:hypothetical protein